MSLNRFTIDIYKNVINEVIDGVRESFIDDGMDELLLVELKQIWESKMLQSKAVECNPSINIKEHVNSNNCSLNASNKNQYLNIQSASTANRNIPHMIQINRPVNNGGMILSANANNNIQYVVQQPAQFFLQNGQIVSLTSLPLANQQNISQNNSQNHLKVEDNSIIQLDGLNDSSISGEELDDDDEDDDIDSEKQEDEIENGEIALNSGDDISETNPSELFDIENVIVCQYEKIHRNKNKWKFNLKDGIMNLNGHDYLFNRSVGESEW